MKVAVGIDLGTTFSAVSFYDALLDRARVISDDNERTVTPSIVAFTNTEQLIGYDARLEQIRSNPSNTLTEMKRLLGRKFSAECVQEGMARWSFTVVEVDEEPRLQVMYRHEVHIYRPTQICAMLLLRLKYLACEELKISRFGILDAVITVPVNYDEAQRQATIEACKIAGINPTKIITDPAAVALTYCIHMEDACEIGATLLVFDMGGGTTDVSVLRVGRNNEFEVLGCSGNDHLGGEDLDTALVEQCLDHIYEEFGVSPKSHLNSMARLRRACEQAKRRLGIAQETLISLDELDADGKIIHFNYNISRKTFENLITPILEKSVSLIDTCLDQAQLKPAQLTKVLLSGGSCLVPKLYSMLKLALPEVALNQGLTMKENVALGAALQGAIDYGLLNLPL